MEKRFQYHKIGFWRRGFQFSVGIAVLLLINGCALHPPRLATAEAPQRSWSAPQKVATTAEFTPTATPVNPHGGPFTLSAAIDIALRNNPATRAAWADARAAAGKYGSSRGAWFPALTVAGNVASSKGVLPVSSSTAFTSYTASASLSYLLIDCGGRSAAIEESRNALLAANWTHNAVIQNTVLLVEAAFFNHAGAVALLEANQISLTEAQTDLAAAEERQRVGVATKADILQAQTNYAEAKLAVQNASGILRKAKGALAVALGLPANIAVDLATAPAVTPTHELTATADQLIAQAYARRPELQAAWAQANAAQARVGEARSRMLPTLSALGSFTRTTIDGFPNLFDSYSIALGVQIPIFNGLSYQYDLYSAQAQADAAHERARAAAQAVSYQVFAAHSDVLTAVERLKTTADLLASARQAADMALGRYKEGVGSILELLTAQRILASARTADVNARSDWYIAAAQLAHDIGILSVTGDNSAMTERVQTEVIK